MDQRSGLLVIRKSRVSSSACRQLEDQGVHVLPTTLVFFEGKDFEEDIYRKFDEFYTKNGKVIAQRIGRFLAACLRFRCALKKA